MHVKIKLNQPWLQRISVYIISISLVRLGISLRRSCRSPQVRPQAPSVAPEGLRIRCKKHESRDGGGPCPGRGGLLAGSPDGSVCA